MIWKQILSLQEKKTTGEFRVLDNLVYPAMNSSIAIRNREIAVNIFDPVWIENFMVSSLKNDLPIEPVSFPFTIATEVSAKCSFVISRERTEE